MELDWRMKLILRLLASGNTLGEAATAAGVHRQSFGHVRAVLLFLPPGNLGDYPYLFRSLAIRSDSTVLFPTSRWITGEIEALRDRNGLTFVDLSERLAQIEVDPTARIPLPASRCRRSIDKSSVRAVIHAGNGLIWDQVSIEVTAGRTILLKAPGQEGKYRFSPNSQLQEDHAVGMLMRLAVDGQWRNPSLAAADYYRVSKAFLRLRQLLQTLVPLPGQPFKKMRGAYSPVFRIRLHSDLVADLPRIISSDQVVSRSKGSRRPKEGGSFVRRR